LVKIEINEVDTNPVSMNFRIPDWTENPVVSINGVSINESPKPGSYLEIKRRWKIGDEIILDFPMPVRLMEANPKVTKLTNKVAVMRGPLVYCLEIPKQEGGEKIFKNCVFLLENVHLTPEYRDDFLGGVTVLKGKALTQKEKDTYVKKLSKGWDGQSELAWEEKKLYRPIKPKGGDSHVTGSVEFQLIPYYAWANRGLSYMDVWIPLAR